MKIEVRKANEYSGHTGAVYALEKYQNTFISAGSDRIVVKWLKDTGDGEVIAKSTDAVFSLKITGATLLIGEAKGGLHIVDLNTAKEIKFLQLHNAPVFQIAATEEYIYTAGGDGVLCILNSNYDLIKKITISKEKLRTILILENNILIGDSNGVISIVDSCLNVEHRFQAHKEGFGVYALCMFPTGGLILSGSRDAHLNIYTYPGFGLQQSIPAHKGAVYDIAFHHSGKIFATASRDKTIKLWDASIPEVLLKLDDAGGGHKYSVNKLLWLNDALLSTGDDRCVINWKLKFLEV